ncbi:molecular chaperone, partial [Vibrio diabolicus]
PIAINNVEAQSDFYSRENLSALKLRQKQAQEPEKLARLLEVYHESLGYNIVRRAEEAKVALSEQASYRTGINLLSELIEVDVQRDE